MELDDFWSLTIKTVSYNASASTKILTVLLRFGFHNKQERVVPNVTSSVFSGKLKQLDWVKCRDEAEM